MSNDMIITILSILCVFIFGTLVILAIKDKRDNG